MRLNAGIAALALLVPFLTLTGTAATASGTGGATGQEGRPCHLQGVSERTTCHIISVPEDRANPASGRTVDLHVAILPARVPKPAPTPLFILAGGPGQAAGEFGGLINGLLDRVRETRDIVLMDQRGTGKSGPLRCRFGRQTLEQSMDPDALTKALEGCRRDWTADPALYSTLEVIDDVDAVRSRLGYPQLDLWGGSWGTRTALLYIRAYPDRVRSAVLDGVTPPNSRLLINEPGFSQMALDRVFADCAADGPCSTAFPELGVRFGRWLKERDPAAPLQLIRPDTGAAARLPLDNTTIVQTIRGSLYRAESQALLPIALERLLQGDATPLIGLAAAGGSMSDSMFLGSTLGGLCREELQRSPASDMAAAASGFTGDSWYRWWSDACRRVTVAPLPAGYDTMVTTDVPVLVLSGRLDPITPPESAEPALAGLKRHWHITVPASGHIVSSFPCANRLITEFIAKADGSDLDSSCLMKRGRPPFVISPTGPRA
jgi:pimeloyl-ACP methyl ester carboxylesterase